MQRTDPNRPGLPFWGKREFHVLVTVFVVASAALAAYYFELRPRLKTAANAVPTALKAPPEAWKPDLPDSGSLHLQLEGVVDKAPVAEVTEAHKSLVSYVEKVAPEILQREAKEFDHSAFLGQTAALRGLPVLVSALLLDWKPVVLDPNESPLRFLYRAYLLDPSGNQGYVVDLTDEPDKSIAERTMVTTAGLFYGLGAYEAVRGPVTAPRIVAHNLRTVGRPVQYSIFQMKSALVLLAVVACILLPLIFWIRHQGAAPTRRRAKIHFPEAMPPRQPWEGFADRAWAEARRKSEGAGVARPRFNLRRKRSASGAEPSALTGKQSTILLVALVACSAILAVMLGLKAFSGRGSKPVALDFAVELKKSLGDASAARESIAAVEKKALAGENVAGPEGIQVIRNSLPRIQESVERIQSLLNVLRGGQKMGPNRDIDEAIRSLGTLKLWILDASDVLDAPAEGILSAGFYMPFERLSRDAASALAALDGTPLAEKAPREAARETDARIRVVRALELLEGARKEVERLGRYVREGLADDSLTGDELRELKDLQEESNRIEAGLTHARALLPGLPIERAESDR